VAFVQARDGIGSATRCGLRAFHTSAAATSTKFGFAFLTASRPALMPRIESTSSTVPFSHVAIINRCSSSAFGTLDRNFSGAATGAASTWDPACTWDPALAGLFSVRLKSDATTVVAGAILMSINVRRQLFLQKLQRVDSLRVVR